MADLNIAEFFLTDRLGEGLGEKVALRTDETNLTYSEVEGLANRYAHALAGAGIEREERVFLAMPDGADFVGAFFGTLKLGAAVVMVNPELPKDRVAELYGHCRPRAVVVPDDTETGFAAAAGDFGAAVVSPAHVGTAGVDPVDAVATSPRDPAIWLFSGGTTGVPKVVVQTHGSFVNTTRRYAQDTLGYQRDDITLSIPKLYFGYATGSNLLFPFSVGASTVLFPEHPTPELVFDLIERHRPTIFITVPTMVAKMVGHSGRDLSSLRFATSAGEALPQELYRAWKDAFGVELLDGLGTAEMWHIFISNRPGAVKPGTVGRPVVGFEVKVCDEVGEPVPDGEVGRLWVKGDSMALGYWDDPEQTAAAFQGPWFVGGDLIRIDDEGYVEHHGRADDRLKVGGKWLAPQEVESCLLEHEAVDTAVVVGVPDAAGLIKPVAFIIPTEPRDGLEEELATWALDRLEAYKHPRRVIIVDSLPTTHLGKVDRTKLKEMAKLP